MQNEGFLFINKPKGVTSFDCVGHIKKIVGKGVKIGHAGTLDPFATGLLIIAIGRGATKHLDELRILDKEYIARGKLGELTDTLDNTGQVIQTCAITDISAEKLINTLQSLQPSYKQIPPIYSALKYKGKRLYALAREGKLSEHELVRITQEKAKEVFVSEAKLLDFDLPYFTVKVRVSHGTYVRSLMHDIACRVDSCATTYALERSAIGSITIDDAVDLNMIKSGHNIEECLISYDQLKERLLNN